MTISDVLLLQSLLLLQQTKEHVIKTLCVHSSCAQTVARFVPTHYVKGFGKIVGPMEESSAINLHVSPFGVIPKQRTLGQWRLIVDLPNPERHRVHN